MKAAWRLAAEQERRERDIQRELRKQQRADQRRKRAKREAEYNANDRPLTPQQRARDAAGQAGWQRLRAAHPTDSYFRTFLRSKGVTQPTGEPIPDAAERLLDSE